ncbi:MAG: hypothetical protein ACUVQY_01820 [Thermoproteota archaeon]
MHLNPPIDLFDCNTTIGRRSVRNPECAYMNRDLISIMESYGIKYALVSHAMCEECGPIPGNEILLSEIEGYDRFYPCWILLPSYTGELDDLRTLIITMVKKGLKLLRYILTITISAFPNGALENSYPSLKSIECPF